VLTVVISSGGGRRYTEQAAVDEIASLQKSVPTHVDGISSTLRRAKPHLTVPTISSQSWNHAVSVVSLRSARARSRDYWFVMIINMSGEVSRAKSISASSSGFAAPDHWINMPVDSGRDLQPPCRLTHGAQPRLGDVSRMSRAAESSKSPPATCIHPLTSAHCPSPNICIH
jgi:hypothetical protein